MRPCQRLKKNLKITETQKAFYVSCINAAIDFIEKDIREKLKLGNIEKTAGLSTFHFHRIFKSFMDESLNNFIRRVRIESLSCYLVERLF
jgi:AraC family transcriptional regulator